MPRGSAIQAMHQIYRVEGEYGCAKSQSMERCPVLAVGEARPISRGSCQRPSNARTGSVHVPRLSSVGREQNLPDSSIPSQGFEHAFLACRCCVRGIPLVLSSIRRMEVAALHGEQITLLKTFADQAVIAIENVRLFQELKESLEQQTATSEIFGVIASSPTDIQPVLDAVATNAARLCDATDAQIRLVEGDDNALSSILSEMLQHWNFRPITPEVRW